MRLANAVQLADKQFEYRPVKKVKELLNEDLQNKDYQAMVLGMVRQYCTARTAAPNAAPESLVPAVSTFPEEWTAKQKRAARMFFAMLAHTSFDWKRHMLQGKKAVDASRFKVMFERSMVESLQERRRKAILHAAWQVREQLTLQLNAQGAGTETRRPWTWWDGVQERPALTESTEMLDITAMDVTPSIGPETAGTQTMRARTMMDVRTMSAQAMQQVCNIVSKPGIGTLSEEKAVMDPTVHAALNGLTMVCGHMDFKRSNV